MSNELTKLTNELQPIPPSALEVIQRAEIDMQIATAHKYPRSMQMFQSRARSMALIDEDTAASCIYSRPVGGGKFAEGLSVRAAEIVGASFGNLRVAATVIEQTDRYVKARGFAHDLESNYACATEVIESTVKKDGTPYDERMRIVIAKSALAKARRDATFQVVPKALFKAIEGECRKLALGEGQSVSTRRARIVAWISKLAIDPKRVWAVLGIAGEADMQDDSFLTLTGLKTSITDGEVTIDEAFPKLIEKAAQPPKQHSQQPKPATQPASTGEPQSGPESASAGKGVASGEAAPGTAAHEPANREPEHASEADGGLPTDPAQLTAYVRGELMRRDVDEKSAVAFMKHKKHCGPKVATIGEMAAGRIAWLAENMHALVAWVNEGSAE